MQKYTTNSHNYLNLALPEMAPPLLAIWLLSVQLILAGRSRSDDDYSPCTTGSLRFINQRGGREFIAGALEYCEGSMWHGVCASKWTEEDAIVACKQLGYSTTGEYGGAVTGIKADLCWMNQKIYLPSTHNYSMGEREREGRI